VFNGFIYIQTSLQFFFSKFQINVLTGLGGNNRRSFDVPAPDFVGQSRKGEPGINIDKKSRSFYQFRYTYILSYEKV